METMEKGELGLGAPLRGAGGLEKGLGSKGPPPPQINLSGAQAGPGPVMILPSVEQRWLRPVFV